MSTTSYDSVKMICKNPSCINKSIVYRKFSHLDDSFECKNCKQILSRFKPDRAVKQNLKAKQQLKEFGL